MLIEVAGPDGAGKSTLIDSARRWLHENTGAKAYERVLRSESRNLLEMLSLDAAGPNFCTRDIELAVLLDAVRLSHADLHVYRRSRRSHAFVSNYRFSLLARLHARGLADDNGLAALVTRIPAPDLSVRLVVPAVVALARLRARHKGDQMLTKLDPAFEAERATRCFDIAGAALAYSHTVLDGTQPVKTLTDELCSLVAASAEQLDD